MKVGGYMCHIISNAKDQLKHVFPYVNYIKKKRCLFSKYAQSLLSYFKEKKSQKTLLSLFYITVIITNFL